MTGVALDSPPSRAEVEIVIPVYDEQRVLEASVRELHAYVQARFPFATTITIADNASTDATWAIATRLEAELGGVRAIHLDQKGRGRALAQAWLASEAPVVAYMDVDLSTDLDALLPLVAPLISGHSDLSIGSRLAPGASVVRGPRRELISRSYNLLLRLALGVGFRDAQCGFKAMRSEVARALLPSVENRAWFFDTELLVLAERAGLRIHELPVDWTDDPDSRVEVVATALEDLRGIVRVSRRLAAGWSLEGLQGLRQAAPQSAGLTQLLRFGLIGLVSTGAYALVYWLLREFWSAPLANAAALVLTGLANTAANRRLTFGVRGRRALARDHLGGLAALGIALLTTSAAIAGLHALAPGAGRLAELAVLSGANVVATITRFLLLRAWIYHPRQSRAHAQSARAPGQVESDLDPVKHARSARARGQVSGRGTQDAWVRPALAAILVLTAALYTWGLDRNGLGNEYYSAAVQAATQSWKAFFFGSLDAGNFITVDKPPLALWVMGLSARLFGLNSWSMLLPEAIAGVLAVALLFDAVRRSFGAVAGLVAALVMALTPVAVVMFRFNNPDALLTLLLVASAWALLRAQAGGRTRWLLLSAAFLGLAFNTKYLQAYVALPALAVTYFVAGPPSWGRRLVQLFGAAGVLVVSSGWWLAIVDAIPAAARPFIGGSSNNTVLDLVLGYDGFGRIIGAQRQGGGGGSGLFGGGFGGFGGQPGWLRLFNSQVGGEISWLLPLAGVGLLAGLWAHRAGPRTDASRAAYLLWGAWVLVHAAVFSFASGIFHAYYTVAMAPAVAALVGGGLLDLWRLRSRSVLGAAMLGAALVITAWWGSRLLARTPGFAPGLGTLELVLASVAAAALLALSLRGLARAVLSRRLALAAVAVGGVAVLLGPAAYAVDTVARAGSGPDPAAGPAASVRGPGGPGGARFAAGGAPPGAFGGGPGAGGSPGQVGGAFGRGAADPALVSYLKEHQGASRWLVAVSSASESASIQLASGRPVMAMGGFSGGDPALSVTQLRALVSSGKLRYVVLGGARGGGGPGGRGFAPRAGPPGGPGPGGGIAAQARNSWVSQNCQQVSYSRTSSPASGSVLYDCSAAVGIAA